MVCKDCFTGTHHRGTPSGRVEKVHGIETYLTGASLDEAKGIIIIIPDAFGWTLSNNRILADNYAKRTGCIVYLPDFHNGWWVSPYVLDALENASAPQKGLVGNLWRGFEGLKVAFGVITGAPPLLFFNRVSVARPRISAFLTALRADEKSARFKIGVAGFCWGGLHGTLLADDEEKAVDGRPLADAFFNAHPSALKVPEYIEKIKLPYSVVVGDIDLAMKVEDCRKMEKVLKAKGDDDRYECVIIPGARHGFAVRGNYNSEEDAKKCQQAEDQAVNWFKKYLEIKD